MQVPLQITARNFELTEAIESAIRKNAEKLDRFYERIMSCKVVVEAPVKKHHQKGIVYNVRLNVTIPGGGEIVVNREPHEDLYVSINNAFDTAHRQLKERVSKQRGEVKYHEEPQPRAKITQLFPHMDYGLITTLENREIYFHRNSVVDTDFEDLEIGMEVRFVESMGEEGPQASTVRVIKK